MSVRHCIGHAAGSQHETSVFMPVFELRLRLRSHYYLDENLDFAIYGKTRNA